MMGPGIPDVSVPGGLLQEDGPGWALEGLSPGDVPRDRPHPDRPSQEVFQDASWRGPFSGNAGAPG